MNLKVILTIFEGILENLNKGFCFVLFCLFVWNFTIGLSSVINCIFCFLSDIDLDTDKIIQEFLQNQFLLHGHVISLGIMVIITSISPLRVYILDNGWMVRIADKPFHPVNYSDTETFLTMANMYEVRQIILYT